MKLLIMLALALFCASFFSPQQAPRGVRKSDDAETIPSGPSSGHKANLLYEAAAQAGGLNVGGAVLQATSGNGFNGKLSVSWKTEIGGEEVTMTVEYEPPPNMARTTALRLFRLDVEKALLEFPPIKTPAG